MRKLYFFLLLMCVFVPFAGAQEIQQLDVFSGTYDYKAFGNTLNTVENGSGGPCTILTSSSATYELEADQTVVAAYLYWAGTGTGDFDIELNGSPLTAERTFADSIDAARVFFAAFFDVTSILQNTGPGEYTVSELDVSDQIPTYCNSGTNFAGWAITVIFEDPDLPLNQINVFDGLQSVSQVVNNLDIELENLNVIDTEDAKIGFIAWEGDAGISVNETLSINGNVLSNPPLNPSNNQFNGTNSFTGASDLFNMDIDFYSIENNISIGDTSATIQLTSGQDFVMINNIITVLNSTLPDAIIALDDVETECQSRTIEVSYTVSNIGTDELEPGVAIAFYGDGTFIGSGNTNSELDPGESESGTAMVTVPGSVADDFELIAIVDDNGTGVGSVSELLENNNESDPLDVSLNAINIENPIEDFVVCDDPSADGEDVFDLTINGNAGLGSQTGITVSYHRSQEDAENDANPIPNPSAYTNTSSPETIYIRFELNVDTTCFRIESFELRVVPLPIIQALEDITVCDDISNDGIESFDLTAQSSTIVGTQTDVAISFYLSQTDAEMGVNFITNASNYQNTENPQTIFVRLSSTLVDDCFDTGSFELFVDDIAIVENPLSDIIICDDPGNDGIAVFDFTDNQNAAIGSQTAVTVTFHLSQEEADDGLNAIPDPTAFTNTANPQTIYLRIIEDDDDVCFSTANFFLEIFEQPVIPVLEDLSLCDDSSNDGLSVFDLTSQESLIFNGQADFDLTYHSNMDDAINNVNPIQTAPNFANIANPQEIFVRLENPLNTDCFDFGSFMLIVDAIDPIQQLDNITNCNEGFETAVFDLSENIDDLNLDTGQTVEGYYLNALDALNQENAIEDPFAYSNTSSPQPIFIRLDDSDPDTCYDLAQFDISIENCPPFVPDGFSPNGDDVNDTFEITGIRDIFDYQLLIYSRLGNLIYEGNNEIPFWDGTPNEGIGGSELPTGTYFWVLKLNTSEYRDMTGWVYLNR